MEPSGRVVVGIVTVALSVLSAGPAAGQVLPPWAAQVSLGGSEIHDSAEKGVFGGARIARALGAQGLFHADVGVGLGAADRGFVTVALGLEARPLPSGPVTPYVRLEGGWLGEDGGGYAVLGVGGGLCVRLGPRTLVRAGALWSVHALDEGGGGPNLYHAGVELRF